KRLREAEEKRERKEKRDAMNVRVEQVAKLLDGMWVTDDSRPAIIIAAQYLRGVGWKGVGASAKRHNVELKHDDFGWNSSLEAVWKKLGAVESRDLQSLMVMAAVIQEQEEHLEYSGRKTPITDYLLSVTKEAPTGAATVALHGAEGKKGVRVG